MWAMHMRALKRAVTIEAAVASEANAESFAPEACSHTNKYEKNVVMTITMAIETTGVPKRAWGRATTGGNMLRSDRTASEQAHEQMLLSRVPNWPRQAMMVTVHCSTSPPMM